MPGAMGKVGGAAVLKEQPKSLKTWYTALAEYVGDEKTEVPESP